MVTGESVHGVLSSLCESKDKVSYHLFEPLLKEILPSFRDKTADRCVFTRDASSVILKLYKAKDEVSSVELQVSSFDSSIQWFGARETLLREGILYSEEKKIEDGAECDFRATVPFDGFAFDLRVERRVMLNGKERLTLTPLNIESIDSILGAFECGGLPRTVLDTWQSARSTIIAATPHAVLTRRFFYNYFTVNEVFSLEAQSVSGVAKFFITHHLDPLDALESVSSENRSAISGVVSCTILPKLCGACSKVSPLDSGVKAQVPEQLQDYFREPAYRVGRGCVVCGYHGTHGGAFIAGALSSNTIASHKINVKDLWESGVRPLIHDAYEKASKGIISLESAAKSGSVLPERYLQIYRPQAHSSPTNKPLSGVAAFRGKEIEEKKPVILVVEDDPDQRAILEMVFKSANYDVDSAANGYEALSVMRNSTPDIIVSDLMMPKIDGAELLQKLKADPLSRNIPVLILTVLTDSSKEFDLLSLGADDYCEKTIQRKILLKRVDNLLKRTKVVAAVPVG